MPHEIVFFEKASGTPVAELARRSDGIAPAIGHLVALGRAWYRVLEVHHRYADAAFVLHVRLQKTTAPDGPAVFAPPPGPDNRSAG